MIADLVARLHAMGIETTPHFSFREHTTIGIGGDAPLGIYPASEEQFIAALRLLQEEGARYVILGNGSNVLASDGGFGGAVISTVRLDGVRVEGELELFAVLQVDLRELVGELEILAVRVEAEAVVADRGRMIRIVARVDDVELNRGERVAVLVDERRAVVDDLAAVLCARDDRDVRAVVEVHHVLTRERVVRRTAARVDGNRRHVDAHFGARLEREVVDREVRGRVVGIRLVVRARRERAVVDERGARLDRHVRRERAFAFGDVELGILLEGRALGVRKRRVRHEMQQARG